MDTLTDLHEVIGELSLIEEELGDYVEESSIYLEGENLDYMREFRTMKKQYKILFKEAKKLYKAGKYNEASKKVAACKTIVKHTEKLIRSMDSTVGGAVIGAYLMLIINSLRSLLISLPCFMLTTIGYAGVAASISDVVTKASAATFTIGSLSDIPTRLAQMITQLVEVIRTAFTMINDIHKTDKHKDLTPGQFNTYRGHLLGLCKQYTAALNRLEKMVKNGDKLKKVSKKKAALQEACDEGRISFEKYDYYTEILNDKISELVNY